MFIERELSDVADKDSKTVRAAWEKIAKKMGWDGRDVRLRLDNINWQGEKP